MAVSFICGGNQSTDENHRPVASHSQTSSHNVVSSTPRHERDFLVVISQVQHVVVNATTIRSRPRPYMLNATVE
jgi:hypothetical protein